MAQPRSFPEPVRKIVKTHFRDEDSVEKIRKLVKRHYPEWADIQLWEMRVICNDYHHKREKGEDTRSPSTKISLGGPVWSRPQPKEFSK